MDPVKTLPTEVFEQVLSYLKLSDLLSCCLVSQKWNIAANNESLWKDLCLENNWSDCGRLKEFLKHFSFISQSEIDAFNNMGEWKKHFVLKNQLQKNWRLGKVTDFIVRPFGNDLSCNITYVSSDGHNLLAFGFDNGTFKLFDLRKGGKLLLIKNCVLTSAVDYIQIINEYLILIQENLLQIYKIESDDYLDLYRVKIVNASSVINVDIPTLMQMDSDARSFLVKESKENLDDEIVFHFNESYLIFGTFYSPTIHVYNIKCDLEEPDVIFDIDLTNSFIFNLHSKNDVLYILVAEYGNLPVQRGPFHVKKWSVQAYSVKSKSILFFETLENNSFTSSSRICTMETNESYLVLRFEFHYFYLFDKNNGKLLLNDHGIIFLNANGNAKLIGVTLDDLFQIINPITDETLFCLTLEGSPIAMFSSVLITISTEFNREGVGSTHVEFWDIHKAIQKTDTIKFPKILTVALLYKDDTKLIFYAKKDCCFVRSFLV
ncbi:uncharacterized protein LOC142318742 [Lycorma delicatula]|uniref:uncharacterized protein LOC142318742 n=1 Tax=Lycorma delicatula TaxID=130591 RepID=UPI003F518E4D